MQLAGDRIGDADQFMYCFRSNPQGFFGASGSFSYDQSGIRDGFIEILNWKGNSTLSRFDHLWDWSSSLDLHNVLSNNTVTTQPTATYKFFDGSSDIPPNNTPRTLNCYILRHYFSSDPSLVFARARAAVLNIAIAYAKSIGILNQWEYAAQIAINHAIQDNILPGYSINLIVINTQTTEAVAVRGALDALSTVSPHAFIGGTLNAETIALQYVLKGAGIPQIAPTASSESLTKRDSFPYFMRPIASEYDEARSILSLMQHFGWSNTAVIVSDEDIGSGGSDALDRVFLGTLSLLLTAFCTLLNTLASNVGAKINILSRQIIALPTDDDTVRQQLTSLKKSNARIVVCIMGLSGFPAVLRIGTELGLFGAEFAWIMGGQARIIDTFSENISSLLVPGVHLVGRFEGEGAVFDRLKADLIALPRSTYPYSGSVVGVTTGIGYVYDACATILKAAILQRNLGAPLTNGSKLYTSMNSVSFEGATGRVEYDNGERVYSSVLLLFRGQNKTWTPYGRVSRANKSLDSYEINFSSPPLFIGGSQTPPGDVFRTLSVQL
jgi:hypothetical protein